MASSVILPVHDTPVHQPLINVIAGNPSGIPFEELVDDQFDVLSGTSSEDEILEERLVDVVTDLPPNGLVTTSDTDEIIEIILKEDMPTEVNSTHPDPDILKIVMQETGVTDGLPSVVPNSNSFKPFLKITEQPHPNRMRFRYECEGRGAGSLVGISTNTSTKTHPAVEIIGYKGPAVVIVSCVEEKGSAPKCHPHKLVGRSCTKGIGRFEVNEETDMTAELVNFGVQCVKRKKAAESFEERKQIQVDPFKQGFEYNKATNLNAIRLCFQAFLMVPGSQPIELDPVVSEVIRDKRAYGVKAIVNWSDDSAPVEGGKKILLFTEKVDRLDIEVHFKYEDQHGIEHTKKGLFSKDDVHHQYAISLRTPTLDNYLEITETIHAEMYLFSKKDGGSVSESVAFTFHPLERKTQRPQRVVLKKKYQPNDSELLSSRNLPMMPAKQQQPKYKDSGSNVVTIEKRTMSFTDKVLMAEDLNSIFAADQPPSSRTRNKSMTEHISQNLSDMKIKNEKVPQSPILETPDASMNLLNRQCGLCKADHTTLVELEEHLLKAHGVHDFLSMYLESKNNPSSKVNNLDLPDD